ncbi:MAG: hypothetical protein K2J26_00250 [Ruminococcus sp.]|nr:hypothetical protein [Ruminococcus sp.]
MKTKKIVIGAMAAAMLSLSVCSLVPVSAAGETVQISASNETAKAGEKFTVEVTLADIPDTGVQCCNFAIEYDKSVISVDSIEEGALSKNAAANDPSASMLPIFNSWVDKKGGSSASVMWSTSLDDSTYWLKGEGVLCTITGTVAADAKAGAKSEIKIVPVSRETSDGSVTINDEIDCGYLKDSVKVSYDVKVTNGSVTVPGGDIEPGGDDKGLKGDTNCDGEVSVADATLLLQHLGNKDKYVLTDKGALNADVDGEAGLSAMDALYIQMYDAGALKEFK